jgi:hypothetical protein
MAFALAVAVAVIAMVCCVPDSANHASISFGCGILATANDLYLDGSHNCFQQGSYHLGKGTRTWGEVYGIKVWRVYLSLGVKHTDPSVTPEEAEE